MKYLRLENSLRRDFTSTILNVRLICRLLRYEQLTIWLALYETLRAPPTARKLSSSRFVNEATWWVLRYKIRIALNPWHPKGFRDNFTVILLTIVNAIIFCVTVGPQNVYYQAKACQKAQAKQAYPAMGKDAHWQHHPVSLFRLTLWASVCHIVVKIFQSTS